MTIRYPYNTNQIHLSESSITYIDEGSGPKTLLFIHGLAGYALSWKKNIDVLRQHYRCIAIDLPGNGLSDRTNRTYSIQFFAETVYELIEKLQLQDVCLVGHSMGGQIAMTAILNHANCAEELILCASAGFEKFSVFEKTMYQTTLHMASMFTSDESSLRQVTENSFYQNQTQAEEMIKDLIAIMRTHPLKEYRKMIEDCILGMVNEPVHEQLHHILQPTLIIYGEQDAFIPNKLIHHISTQQLAEEATNKMRAATLEIIPYCGHFAQWEKAEEVNKYILEFLKNN